MSEPQQYTAAYYRASVSQGQRFMRIRFRRLCKLLKRIDGQRVLDIGCGAGISTMAISRNGGCPVAVDSSPIALEIVRLVEPKAGLICADCTRLPVVAGSMDKVLAADITEHSDGAALGWMMREARRVLKPEGFFIIYTPNPGHLFEHLKRYGLFLKRDHSHTGLRSARQYLLELKSAQFATCIYGWAPTHLPIYSWIEWLLGRLPIIGSLFRRRLWFIAQKQGVF